MWKLLVYLFIMILIVSVCYEIIVLMSHKRRLVANTLSDDFPPYLHDALAKKLNQLWTFPILSNVLFHAVCATLGLNYKHIISWDSLLEIINTSVPFLRTHSFDAVIGIKTGGAFLAEFMARKLNIPSYFVKCHHYGSSGTIGDVIKEAISARTTKVYKELEVTDELMMISLCQKNILLVDDNVCSGSTLFSVQKYLKDTKMCKKIFTGVLAAPPNHELIDMNFSTYHFQSRNIILYPLPWGYDP